MPRAALVNGDREATLPNPSIGRLIGGRYHVLGLLGRGGMAAVYLARDTRLGREVAIKALRPELAADPAFLRRFHREAEAAAALSSHPNIVAIHDIGQDGPLHYLVMEYVEGETLKSLIQREAPLDSERTFAIGAQIASALAAAHARGLVHRDVKPQNILITPEGTVKVTDFGIARHSATTSTTAPGAVVGTADYLSPEQARGAEVGPASDLYSLGVVLYEMLSGRLPFVADTPMGVAMQHVHDQPPALGRPVPREAAALVRRALAKKPARRYRSAAEMERALRAGQGISSRPLAPRRRKSLLAIVIPLVAALVIAAALIGWAISQHAAPHRSQSHPTARPVATRKAATHPAVATSAPVASATTVPPTAIPSPLPTFTAVLPAQAPPPPGHGKHGKIPPGQEKEKGPKGGHGHGDH